MILTHLVLFGFWSGAGGTVTPAAPAATPLTGGKSKQGRKRKRIFIWEPPEEEEVAPIEANRETVRRAIVTAYKSGEEALGLLQFSTEPDGPKLDLIDLLAELKAREPLYAQNLVNLLRKLREDEDEEDIELLLMS